MFLSNVQLCGKPNFELRTFIFANAQAAFEAAENSKIIALYKIKTECYARNISLTLLLMSEQGIRAICVFFCMSPKCSSLPFS